MLECARKCSHCGHNGHNSRTCSKVCAVGFKLFGVHIDVGDGGGGGSGGFGVRGDESDGGVMRKCKSMGNLLASKGHVMMNNGGVEDHSGYLSDGYLNGSSKLHGKKKGKPWSEDEHRSFLAGLETLGKGDWKGISKNFVPTRNSSQVASHAQKYFIRMAASEKKRRRTSVFDIPFKEVVQGQQSEALSGSSHDKIVELLQQASNVVVCDSFPDTNIQSSLPVIFQDNNSSPSPRNTGEFKGHAHVTTSEKPPLSPKAKHDLFNYRSKAFVPSQTSFTQGFQAKTIMPTVSWVPVLNFQNRSSIYPSNDNVVCENVAGSTRTTTTTASNEDYNLNIRNITI